MENIKIRLIAIIFLLAGFSILQLKIGHGQYTHGRTQNVFQTFPLKMGEWVGYKVPFNENVYNILETEAIVVNRYVSGNNVVNLSIVYYPEVKVDFHSPEGCSTGLGEKIEKLRSKEIIIIQNKKKLMFLVNVFIVYGVNGDRRVYYYMYKAGDFISESYIKLRFEMAKMYLFNRGTSGALVVFSAPVYRSVEDSEKIIYEFIKSSYPIINKFI